MFTPVAESVGVGPLVALVFVGTGVQPLVTGPRSPNTVKVSPVGTRNNVRASVLGYSRIFWLMPSLVSTSAITPSGVGDGCTASAGVSVGCAPLSGAARVSVGACATGAAVGGTGVAAAAVGTIVGAAAATTSVAAGVACTAAGCASVGGTACATSVPGTPGTLEGCSLIPVAAT